MMLLYIFEQVICNADLMFIGVLAKWPGSVHDARILRQSRVFTIFEGKGRPVDGVMLGDSGYMIRDWLLTPFQHPTTLPEIKYNAAHKCTHSTVDRTVGMWSLHSLAPSVHVGHIDYP